MTPEAVTRVAIFRSEGVVVPKRKRVLMTKTGVSPSNGKFSGAQLPTQRKLSNKCAFQQPHLSLPPYDATFLSHVAPGADGFPICRKQKKMAPLYRAQRHDLSLVTITFSTYCNRACNGVLVSGERESPAFFIGGQPGKPKAKSSVFLFAKHELRNGQTCRRVLWGTLTKLFPIRHASVPDPQWIGMWATRILACLAEALCSLCGLSTFLLRTVPRYVSPLTPISGTLDFGKHWSAIVAPNRFFCLT
jgi:hypothetical protein